MHDLTVTIIQDDLSWQDPVANRERYQQHFESIRNTDLIVLPEFFSTGFYQDPNEKYEVMEGETVQWMSRNAVAMDAVITGSVVLKLEAAGQINFMNRMLWARPDGTVDWYDKRHLFRFGGEHHAYKGGNQRVVFGHKGWAIAPFVCYDLRFPVWCRNRSDYDIALYVANWPNARQYAWDMLVRARAIENQCYVLAVNRLGCNPYGEDFSGGSVILDFMGMPVRDCSDAVHIASTSLSYKKLMRFREHFPASLDQDDFTLDC